MKTWRLHAVTWLAAVLPAFASAQSPPDPAFAKGADLSLLQFIENHGVQYREDGQTRDALAIFKAHGCNYVRLRLFVNPDGTHGQVNSLPYTLALAKRVRQAGFRWLLDLHYSDGWADPSHQTDGWADPSHQTIPAEWKSLAHGQLVERVFSYTRDTPAAFEKEGCPPDMVQVGNEITNGMMWPAGGPLKNSDDFNALVDLLKAGVRAVRASPAADRIKVMIHVGKGGNREVCKWFFDNCQIRGVTFDVIGLSYYPFLHGSLDDLGGNLAFLSMTYQKDLMVVETSYNAQGNAKNAMPFPYTPEGQKAFLEALLRTVAATPGGHGKGVFYWAPEWVMSERWNEQKRPSEWEDRALFDHTGNALPAMSAYQFNQTAVK